MQFRYVLLSSFITVQESDAVRERYPMLFMNQRAPGHGDPCIKVHLDLQRKRISKNCLPPECPEGTLRRSNTDLSASRENYSLIAGKEEKPDAKWQLWASNKCQKMKPTQGGAETRRRQDQASISQNLTTD